MSAALAQFRNPGDIQRVEKDGATVYKRVMLLSPGIWADAGSQQHVDYAPEGIRASADNFVDIEAVRAAVPEWPRLSNAERAKRLRDLGDEVVTDELPINFLHGPALFGAESLDAVGHIPAESVIVDDDSQLYGDLVLHGDTPQSETAIDLMDEVLEAATTQGVDPPPVGPSVEIPADDVVTGEQGLATLQEAWFSAVGIVFNPASRPVELGTQAAQRAVAMTAADGAETAGVIHRAAGDNPFIPDSYRERLQAGDTLIKSLRQRWRMANDGDPTDDLPNFDDMDDEDLRRALETMREDMDELEAALQGEDELSAVAAAVEQYLGADGDPAQGADEFRAWAIENTELDEALIEDVLAAYLEAAGAEDLSETPVEALQGWLAEQMAADGEGEGDGEGGEPGAEEEGELSVADLEAVKQVVGEVSEHLGDIKDLLTARESDRAETLEELERRLTEIEDEPQPRSLTGTEKDEFYTDDGEGGAAAEHEDVFL